jgi:hypothetical protein
MAKLGSGEVRGVVWLVVDIRLANWTTRDGTVCTWRHVMKESQSGLVVNCKL